MQRETKVFCNTSFHRSQRQHGRRKGWGLCSGLYPCKGVTVGSGDKTVYSVWDSGKAVSAGAPRRAQLRETGEAGALPGEAEALPLSASAAAVPGAGSARGGSWPRSQEAPAAALA